MTNKLFLIGNSSNEVSNKKNKLIFNEIPLIFRENGSATRLAMERYLLNNKIEVLKKMELTSNEAVKQAVIAGLGISIMPIIGMNDALQKGDLRILKIKNLPIETNWNLIWLKTKNLSRVAKAFKNHVIENKEIIIKDQFEKYNNY